MKKSIKIGDIEFKYKKDAIAYYRAILNSYNFGESLTEKDYYAVFDLLEYDRFQCQEDDIDEVQECQVAPDEIENASLTIEDIKIGRVQFNTKCFELFYDDGTRQYISYLSIINQKIYTPDERFNVACRNSIHDDIRAVKQQFFDENSVKGKVRCQESNVLSLWIELVVDHRQPNTFSIIVDRFKELNNINVNDIEYVVNDENHFVFQDVSLSDAFVSYHKSKARLRLVRKELNSVRSSMGRVKKSTKDLIVK